jgi:hypothetical protein
MKRGMERNSMRRLFSSLLVVLVIVLLAGCQRLTAENLGKVEAGMTEQQVRKILGKPTTVDTGSMLGVTGTTYHYKSGGSEVSVVFVGGKVLSKSGNFK